ncbi:podocalyxin isoform 1-T1 [Chlamydotis macqueenii]
MRAQLLLPLLLLGVSSQIVMTASPSSGENGQTSTTTDTSKVQGTTPTNKPGHPPSTLRTSPAAVQGTTPTNNPGNPPSIPTISPQKVSSSTSLGTSTVTPAASPSTVQQKISLGSSGATTAVSPVPTHADSPPATTGGLGTAVTSPSNVEAQGSQPSNQLTSTAASTGVTTSSLPPGLKDSGVSSPTSVTKQPHSSPSSAVRGLASSTRSGSTDTSVTPFDGSVSTTTIKASLPPGSINRVSEAATTPTAGADQRSHDTGSVSTKPATTPADQRPASAQPSAPAPGDQIVSSGSGHQHPNASFQNEVICKDQVQNNLPTMYLKEAKTCAEWRTASVNISFFESFCSTGQHAFNASREMCTVILTSHEPRSQHWAVQAFVRFPLDPESVLKELKEKDKLEELGIANITYGKMEGEMIINDEFSTPLIITIVTLAGSLLLIAAIYGCCHQRFSQKKDQHVHPDLPGFDDGHVALIFNQRLTEELQTMENGYHDNPTLEVMETSSEMQEKKVNLNGELGDSWIVPLDTLMKEDLEEEEDTHL